MRLYKKAEPYLLVILIVVLLAGLRSVIGFNDAASSLLFFAAILFIPIYLGFWPAIFFMAISMTAYMIFFVPTGKPIVWGWPFIMRLAVAVAQFTIIIFLAYRYRINRQIKQSSEKRYRALIEHSGNAVILFDNDLKRKYISPVIEKVTGYTTEEFEKLPPMANVTDAVKEEIRSAIAWVRENPGVSKVFIQPYKHKNGHMIMMEISLINLTHMPEVKSFVSNIRDITPQKLAEEDVRVQKNRLEIINSIGQTVSADLDLESILQTVTDATTKLSGAEFGAFFYNTVTETGEEYMLYTLSGAERSQFDKFGMPRNTAVFHSTFAGIENVRVDDIKKDPRYGKNAPHFGMPKGHLPVTSYLAVPVRSKAGDVIGGLFYGHSQPGVFTEEAEKLVTGIAAQAAIAIDNAKLFEAQKKLNEENERLLELSSDLNAKKDEFISIASHELKTPLTTTKAYVQLLQREFEDSEDVQLVNYIDRAANNINKLQTLIDDLLNISKIQAGKLEYNMEEVRIIDVVHEAVENISNTGATHAIRIVGETDALVCGDNRRLEQVVINLLSNAMKYSPGQQEVVLGILDEADQVVISVRDKGIGISEQNQSRLFTRFERLDNDHRFSGLGIGLYLADEIVKRHNGDMWLDSKVGEGSTFYFSLSVVP